MHGRDEELINPSPIIEGVTAFCLASAHNSIAIHFRLIERVDASRDVSQALTVENDLDAGV